MFRKLLLALALLPAYAFGQVQINCAVSTPCDAAAGPANTKTGDAAWKAYGKINPWLAAVQSTTGTGNYVLANSPALTAPNLGIPSFIDLTHAINFPAISLTPCAPFQVLATGAYSASPACSSSLSIASIVVGTGGSIATSGTGTNQATDVAATNASLAGTTGVNADGKSTLAITGTQTATTGTGAFGAFINTVFTPNGPANADGINEQIHLGNANGVNIANFEAVFGASMTIDVGYTGTVPAVMGDEQCNVFTNNMTGALANPVVNFRCFQADATFNGNGSTAGTVQNDQFFATGTNQSGSAGAGAGGTINNTNFRSILPNGGSNGSGGVTTNRGIRISGSGGTNVLGSTINWAIDSVSSADSEITGGVDFTPIGAVSPSTGAFTTLSATSAPTGTGFTALFASPPAIGGTAPAAAAHTGLTAQPVAAPTKDAGSVPYTLLSSAVPMILANGCSLGATGAISACTSLPATYANAYMYFPATVLASSGTGSAAGFYAVQMSSATAGQVCSPITLYASGSPAVVGTCNTFSVNTTGAYVTGTSIIPVLSATLPAHAMGLQGELIQDVFQSQDTSAATKTITTKIGGSATSTAVAPTTASTGVGHAEVHTRNANAENAQTSFTTGTTAAAANTIGTSAALHTTAATNSSQTVTLNSTLSSTTSTFVVFESYAITVKPN